MLSRTNWFGCCGVGRLPGRANVYLASVRGLLSSLITVLSGYRLSGKFMSVKDVSSGKCLLGYCLAGLLSGWLSELWLDMHQYALIFLNDLENYSDYARTVNIPDHLTCGFWICQGSEYGAVLYARVAQSSEYGLICLNNAWICQVIVIITLLV